MRKITLSNGKTVEVECLVILAPKRHIKCELNEPEKGNYINLLFKIRKAQRETLGIEHVYYI